MDIEKVRKDAVLKGLRQGFYDRLTAIEDQIEDINKGKHIYNLDTLNKRQLSYQKCVALKELEKVKANLDEAFLLFAEYWKELEAD